MNLKLEVVKVQGVRGYVDEHNTAWLNVEDVARGLGFTRTAASGNEVVRWERVNGYLSEFGFMPTSGHDVKAGDYIPENIFYRLAMKASNQTAQVFQAKVADEILPSIRNHGVYATEDFLAKSIADPLWAIGVLQALKAEQDKRAVLEVQIAELKPKASYYDIVLQCKDLVKTSIIAKDYGMSAKAFNKLLNKLGVQFKQGDVWLLYQHYAERGWSSTKTHTFNSPDGETHCKPHMYWTQKGRLGLYELLKQKGYLPIVERDAA